MIKPFLLNYKNERTLKMYRIIIVTWIFMLGGYELSFALKKNDFIQYMHPKSGSEYVSCQTTLTIRFQKEWQPYLSTNAITFHVRGDISGEHEGRVVGTNDPNTFIFKPIIQFLPDEIVNVEVSTDLPGLNEAINYNFKTSKKERSPHLMLEEEIDQYQKKPYQQQMETYGQTSVINGVAVPSDFPKINIDILEETAEGLLFLSNTNGTTYIMILENNGTPYFYQRLSGASGDFKVQPSGTITKVGWPRGYGFFEMDSNYQVIDTLASGNGYQTDTHELQLLSNGNYLVIALDEQIVDMSQYVEGGKTEATVIGNHIQELDRDGNVVFEWRSWDYYDITDAIHEDLTAKTIDYVHMNAIAVDYDGHLLVSARNLNEITKINRQTGDIIWRLGGEKSQFDLINDDGFSYQHDIRPVPGNVGHYTLFDNGRYHSPRFSRAVEFLVDTTNMTATKVWEFRPSPDRYSDTRGNVQRLPNGNTLIDWSGGSLPVASEVTLEGEIVHEFNFSENMRTYRSFRFDWEGMLQAPYLIAESWPDKISLIFNKFGDTDITGYIIYGGKEYEPEIVIDTTSNTWIDLTNLDNYTQYHFRVTALNSAGEESGFSNQEEAFVKFVDPGDNIIINGDFNDNVNYWQLYNYNGAIAVANIEDGECYLNIVNAGTQFRDVLFMQENLALTQGKHYLLEFDGYATDSRAIEIKVEKSDSPFENYSKTGFSLLKNYREHHAFEFEMDYVSDFNARIIFNIGVYDNDVIIDNVSLREIVTSSIPVDNDLKPESFQLFKNYPNPFNPVTVISYQLPVGSTVELSIYNLLGQKISVLVSEKQDVGFYQVEWNASNFASGIYYYRMEALGFMGKGLYSNTRKMMVIK